MKTKTPFSLKVLFVAMVTLIVYMAGPPAIFLGKDIARMWVKAWKY